MNCHECQKEGCDDVVGIVTRLRAARSGVRIPVGARDFNWLLGPPSLVLNGYWGYLLEVKQPGPDDHSPPFIAQVNNKYRYTCTLRICFHDADRGNFIL